MNEQKIKENNKLIAEFMDIKVGESYWQMDDPIPYNEVKLQNFIGLDELGYHSSWDWLMPVIIKIIDENSSDFQLTGKDFLPEIKSYLLSDHKKSIISSGKSHLEAAYSAVVYYLKKYETKRKIDT